MALWLISFHFITNCVIPDQKFNVFLWDFYFDYIYTPLLPIVHNENLGLLSQYLVLYLESVVSFTVNTLNHKVKEYVEVQTNTEYAHVFLFPI